MCSEEPTSQKLKRRPPGVEGVAAVAVVGEGSHGRWSFAASRGHGVRVILDT